MSSSFTDQPPPHDPRHEEGYTSTPAASEQKREAEDLDAGLPKLGSLAQKARGKQLRQARIVLFIAAGLTIIPYLIDIGLIRSQFRQGVEKEIQKRGGPGNVQVDRALLQQEEDNAFLIGCAIDGAFILVGVVFVILGVIVYRFPVPVTILGLVLYLLTLGVGLAIVSLSGDAEAITRYLVSGWLFRLLIIVGLAGSIKSAMAYENERRAETEYAGA